ncbi:acetate--CoA ligase [Haloarchaeobius salinus]|uniref:acetate--CoA ligase n=1 Tax=Haloarchaeobius salinus TaxID=1198298 RepID=UPI00210E3BD8|nr:acetate--CoA ligase [Haloarchaeobius salinus]
MTGSDEPQVGEVVDPPAAFVAQAAVGSAGSTAFDAPWPDCWAAAADRLDWHREYGAVLESADGRPPFRWFADGELNASVNCLDRHLDERGDDVALVWEGHLDEHVTYTYRELFDEVNAVAAGLRDLGVGADDVVTTYLPSIPEAVAVMLACARIGAVHNVVFAGFSADALATRMERAESRYLVTCDGYYRRGEAVNQRRRADNARMALPYELEATVVVDRLAAGSGRDGGDDTARYDDILAANEGATVDPVPREASAPLFRMYTSGTTGEPKAVTHTTGGYLAQVVWTSERVLDVDPGTTVWSTADLGWITGHSYVVYGPLSLGATTVLSEGSPDAADRDRPWEVVERNGVNVLYTAPTVVRSFMKWGTASPDAHDLSSLRLLGSVGEPLDAETWHWYHEHVGGGDCPVVDTWWQTETGAVLLTTLPGVDAMKPGSVGRPLAGIDATVRDDADAVCPPGERGWLSVDRPWPAMARELATASEWGAAADAAGRWRYRVGDEAVTDADGYVTVLGRVDDVLNVGGRRFSTAEIEHAIVEVDGVAEAAVIGRDDPDVGTAIVAYVTTEDGPAGATVSHDDVDAAVSAAIGAGSTPDEVVFTPDLPKTRSGKIMRRLLGDIANGEDYGDTSALRNPEVVGELEARQRE